MSCHRCGGYVVHEPVYTPEGKWDAQHCLACGEIVDAVIVLHRFTQDPNAEIPGTMIERPFSKNARGRAIHDPQPQICKECGATYIPNSGKHDYCREISCYKYRQKRFMYTKGLVKKGMPRSEAKIRAMARFPRLKDVQTKVT